MPTYIMLLQLDDFMLRAFNVSRWIKYFVSLLNECWFFRVYKSSPALKLSPITHRLQVGRITQLCSDIRRRMALH